MKIMPQGLSLLKVVIAMGYNGVSKASVVVPAADDNTQLFATRIKSMSAVMRKPTPVIAGEYEPFSVGFISTAKYDKIAASVGDGEGYANAMRTALFESSAPVYTFHDYSVVYEHIDVSSNELRIGSLNMGSVSLDAIPFLPTDGLLLGVGLTVFTSNPPLEGSLSLRILYERVQLTSDELLATGCVC